MTRVTIDGNEVSWDLTGITNIEELMADLYRKTAETGRVVYRVAVDGRELTAGGEKEMASLPLSQVGEVALTTNSPGELLCNSLEGAVVLCDAICADTAKAVEAFRMGEGEKGLSYYLACVESMGTFFQLAGAILNGIRSGYFSVAECSEGPPTGPSAETAEILTRLLDDQKREDWTAMADVLEFEVVPNLQGWKAFLERLQGDQAK
ncbi:MAG: hypothetical protein HZA60_02725 [Deltaproteobacteria bacterium]|nr:hypothetical protein [Deltaproteobacteria bacterium]